MIKNQNTQAAVLTWLKEQIRPATLSEISSSLSITQEQVSAALLDLEGQGLTHSKKGKYTTPERLGMLVGTVQSTRIGKAFLIPDDKSKDALLFMDDEMALNGDKVLAQITHDHPQRKAKLLKVISHANEMFTAQISIRTSRQKKGKKSGSLVVSATPTSPFIHAEIKLEKTNIEVNDGDLVLLQTIKWPDHNHPLKAKISKVLGSADQPMVQLESIVLSRALNRFFPKNVIEEALDRAVPIPDHEMRKRKDLRNMEIFTIDGAYSKDFDDAISLDEVDGKKRLGVHIADVSYYTRPGTLLDAEAKERGTSVYLPNLTLPMLPEALSNNICSLRPNEDRLALSIFIILSGSDVVSYEIMPSVIRSVARLVYDNVNDVLANSSNDDVPENLYGKLKEMHQLSLRIRAGREARGSIDFDLDEASIIMDDLGNPTSITAAMRGEAHRMIEDFMLLANECVAKFLRQNAIPALYRVHETPDPEKLYSVQLFLNQLNYSVQLESPVHPSQLQKILLDIKDKPEAPIIANVMLRAMKKARYAEVPLGHFGLAATDYCHFTSPIRRYPDLIVHRMLKLFLSHSLDEKQLAHHKNSMPDLGTLTSLCERKAIEAEREADNLMKAFFMQDKVGQVFSGVVSGVTGHGFYVSLPNTIEGVVLLSSLNDYYTLNADMHCLVGERRDSIVRLGDKIDVILDYVDINDRKICFVPVKKM